LLARCPAELCPEMNDVQRLYDGYVSGRKGSGGLYNPYSIMELVVSCGNGTLPTCLDRFHPWANAASTSEIVRLVESSPDAFSLFLDIIEGNKEIMAPGSWMAREDIQSTLSAADVLQSTLSAGDVQSTLSAGYVGMPTTRVLQALVEFGYLSFQSPRDNSILVIPNAEAQMALGLVLGEFYRRSKVPHVTKEPNPIVEAMMDREDGSLIIPIIAHSLLFTSFFDLATRQGRQDEALYHLFILGMFRATLQPFAKITSNQESGHGRPDIVVIFHNRNVSYIFELKAGKNEKEDLKKLAGQAVQQIRDQKYYQCCPDGLVICIGLAFLGKTMESESERFMKNNMDFTPVVEQTVQAAQA